MADWIRPRVLELTYTSWDLEPFAENLGYEGPPFRYDPERRASNSAASWTPAFFLLYLGQRRRSGRAKPPPSSAACSRAHATLSFTSSISSLS
jgi:hypothetical protein